jgi:hypothetical protein
MRKPLKNLRTYATNVLARALSINTMHGLIQSRETVPLRTYHGGFLMCRYLGEPARNTGRQHPVEKVLTLLFLLAELAGPLCDQVLQVVAVLLQHLHHLGWGGSDW